MENIKKKNVKKIILGSFLGILIGSLLGTTYAMFTYNRTGLNNELIVGDIYMQYKETKELSLENAMPSENPITGKYFEFKITGKNTTTNKDIWYEIVLNRGNVPTGKQENNRILDKFLKFKLVEVTNNVESNDLLESNNYSDIRNKRIYVATIPKNTTNNIEHIYRLYMWIGSEVGIGTDTDYTISEWNNLFASVMVNVTGDFKEKSTTTPASCFTTSDNGDNTVTITGIVKNEYEINDNMTAEELQNCKNYILNQGYPSYATSVCDEDASRFSWMLENGRLTSADLQFFINNNIAVVSNAIPEICTEKNIIIPEKIDNKTVTSIASLALSNAMLNSVEIPNTITTIGENAFYNNNLTSVVIPNSVTTIGLRAFQYNQLTSVTIGNSVTTIGGESFANNQLTSIEIPNSVTTIDIGAFRENQLTSVVIPDSVQTIWDNAF